MDKTSCLSSDQSSLSEIHQVLKPAQAIVLGKTRTRRVSPEYMWVCHDLGLVRIWLCSVLTSINCGPDFIPFTPDISTSQVYATDPPMLALTPLAVPTSDPLAKPIRPARKGRKGQKRENVFHDDCRFPDQSDEFDYLLHNEDSGQVLHKRQHP